MNFIDINNFPYGEITVTLQQAVNYVNENLHKVEDFDYPDYWSLPKSVSYKLSSDEVDFIQSEIFFIRQRKNS